VGAGGALRQDALALEFKRLTLPLALGFLRMGGCGIWLRGGGLLLLFHGFALPST
jgi:hypothetical protein